MTFILLFLTLVTCIVSIVRPWIGVVAYFTLAIMAPQFIWPWIFTSYRISLLIAASTFLGTIIGAANNQLNFKALKHRQNILLLTTLVLLHLSNIFTPFADHAMPGNMIPPSFTLESFNKIIIFYLIAVTAINTQEKLRYMFISIAFVSMYYAYWCNNIYFSGLMYVLNDNGRLAGPNGIYSDENALAMLLVTTMPFIYYSGLLVKKNIYKLGIWSFIPLLWHAVFLTASRGGMLSLAAATLFIALRSKSKALGIVILFGLAVAIATQASSVLNRSTETEGQDISFSDDEAALDPRLISWRVGFDIIADYPFLGVGVSRFQQAFPNYSETKVHVAHNTFIQFASGSGLFAGLIYIGLFYSAFKGYRKDLKNLAPDEFLYVCNEATAASLIAFFICAVFLDLMTYEIFYLLLIVNISKQLLSEEHAQK